MSYLHTTTRTPALTGSLEQIALSDVVQIVANDPRAGVLMLDSARFRGAIWFRAGQIVGAELGGRSGAEAFYAAMTITDGQFRLVFDVPCPRPNVDAPTFPLLMEGARRIDECNRIRATLQSDDFDFVRSDTGSVAGEDLVVAFLFGAPCSVDRAVGCCAIGELEALETVARLVAVGVLNRVSRTDAVATLTAA